MEYIFKGMVVYNGGHYMTYIRNMKSKLVFAIDPLNMEREISRINGEICEETEWTLHNDCNVSNVSGNWKQIVQDCIQSRCQPTLLLYEKFSMDDNEFMKVAEKRLFEFDRYEVKKLLEKAGMADDSYGGMSKYEIEM